MEGDPGGTQLLWYMISVIVEGIAFWAILSKTGNSKLWLLLLLIPLGYFALWLVLAAARWPNQEPVQA
jgi:hypothetical protein